MFLRPIHFLFTSYSFPIHPYFFLIHCLFISFSFSFLSVHVLLILMFFLFIAYSLPFHFHSFFFHFLWPEKFTKIPKSKDHFYLSIPLFKNCWFQAPNQLGKGVPHKSPKKWFIKGVVNKVLGLLDGYPCHILIGFLFNSYSFPIQFLFMFHSFLFIPYYSFWLLSFPKLFKKRN